MHHLLKGNTSRCLMLAAFAIWAGFETAVALLGAEDQPPVLIAGLFGKTPKTEAQLISDLGSPKTSTVVSALGKLQTYHPMPTNALPRMKELLGDPRSEVRREVVRTLGSLSAEVSEADVRTICASMQSIDDIIYGLQALRSLKATNPVPEILPFLKNSDPRVIRHACRTLAVLGNVEAVPAIEPLLHHSDRKVKKDAEVAIAQLRLAENSAGKRNTAYVGTGFVVASGGYILTCDHVVKGARKISVRDNSGTSHPAVVIASDPANDLCLLQASTITTAPIPTVPPNSLEIGQPVYCLGYPMEGSEVQNFHPVASSGIVAALRGLGSDSRHVQVTLTINAGNSGGPIFDSSGRWVAVVSHKLNDLYSIKKTGQLPQGFNFGVKSALAWPLFDSLPATRMSVAERAEPVPLEELVKRLSGSVVFVIALE